MSAPTLPSRVPLATKPLGVLGSLQAGRRNVLELIPEIATHAPILSGRTGKRWHMVMEPGALRGFQTPCNPELPGSAGQPLFLREIYPADIPDLL